MGGATRGGCTSPGSLCVVAIASGTRRSHLLALLPLCARASAAVDGAMSRCTAACCAHRSSRRVLALLLGAAAAASRASADAWPPATLGWAHGADASLVGQDCSVDRRAAAEISQHEFNTVYLVRSARVRETTLRRLTAPQEKQPVVLTGLAGNERVRELCSRERLLGDWVRAATSRQLLRGACAR